jgi:hypothetical protein
MSFDTFLGMKRAYEKEEALKDLGEEAVARDSKAKKIKYKAGCDDGKKRLHKARWNRQPLSAPEVYYKHVPKKHDTIIRNFPLEHYGVAGQIPEAVLGHMHNRAVKVSLDSFCKSTFKAAKGGERAGKYADMFQLLEAVTNYGIALHALWPSDYTGWVFMKVLTQAKWGEVAGLTGR